MARVYDYTEILGEMSEALARGDKFLARRSDDKRTMTWAYLEHMRRLKNNKNTIRHDVESIETALWQNKQCYAAPDSKHMEATERSFEALQRIKLELIACTALVGLKLAGHTAQKKKRREKKYFFTSKKHRMFKKNTPLF